MTTRRGAIGMLAVIGGALGQEKSKPADGATRGSFVLDLAYIKEILVRHGKREVKLTAKEIMDALEGK